MLTQALIQETDRGLLPALENFVRQGLELTFLPFLQPQHLPEDRCREELWSFLKKLLQKSEARRAFFGPWNSIQNQLLDRYLDRCFASCHYVHFELTKVQRLRTALEETRHLIKATLLLRPAIHMLTVDRSAEGTEACLLYTSDAADE